MRQKPVPQQIYRHFKGGLYQIITLAEHTETGECLVIYQALYGDYRVYARPLSMFMEKVDREKYPEALQEYRFEIMDMPSVSIEGGVRRRAETGAVQTEDQTEASQMAAVQEEETGLDPMVLAFLDADSYEERLNILTALHHRITDDMINTMAMAVDVEIREGDLEERYAELRNCLLLYDKFECSRLR